MSRDYKSEYENYHSSDRAKKKRAENNAARRKMEKAGKVSKGDGKDVTHKKNRAGMKAIRARYAPFIRYMKNVKKLQGEEAFRKIAYGRYADHLGRAELIELAGSNTLDGHYKAMMSVAWPGYGCNPFSKFEKEMMHYHSDEAFVEVTLPLGQLAVDKYKSFF